MPTPCDQALEHARFLHRQGQLRQAERAYEALAQGQDNADVLGLLALCKFQGGKEQEAFALWRRILVLEATSRISWRNSNNALAAAFSSAERTDAHSLVPQRLPAWDSGLLPTAADISMVQSLVTGLERIGRTPEADELLATFIKQIETIDPEAIALMRFALDKNLGKTTATEILNAIDRELEPSPEHLLIKGAASSAIGKTSESEAIANEVARLSPLYFSREMPGQRFVLGVLNRPPPAIIRPMSVAEFHFHENTPASLVKQLSSDLRFVSFFPTHDAKLALASLAIRPDVILNNWANGEMLAIPGALESIKDALQGVNAPIINSPDQVLLTTRQRNSERLQGIAEVKVPKVVRFEHWSGNEIPIALMLEAEVGFPLIIREPFQQMGFGALKIGSPDQLLSALSRLGAGQYYAIAYIENPLAANIYRKFRAAIIGQSLFITHVHFGSGWNVHRVRDPAEMERIAAIVRHIPLAKALIEEPESPDSLRVISALRKIRERVPLDMFGIDFDLMPDGRVLFFEANAAMNLSFNGSDDASSIRGKMKAALMQLLEESARHSGRVHWP